jgi:hypothetical protein
MIEYRFRVSSAAVFTLYSYSKALEYRFRVPTAGSLSHGLVDRAYPIIEVLEAEAVSFDPELMLAILSLQSELKSQKYIVDIKGSV